MTIVLPAAAPRLNEGQKGIIYCAIAHLFWGGMAMYFGLIRHVSPVEIAVHRGLWSLPIAAAVLWWMGGFRDVARILADRRVMLTLCLSSFLIVFNWGVYVWTIEVGRTLESSLGYYINPLFNVVAGYFFLGERFTRAQILAIGLAVLAVVIQTIGAGVFPWIGLLLGSTFCLYGFLRKTVDAGPVEGFFVETLIIVVPLLACSAWLAHTGEAYFLRTPFDTLMLMGCGVMTSGALLFFTAAIKRIRYSTAGLMQYISPSLVFLTAVFVFGEHMDVWRLLSFVIIWIALAIFTVSALREDRARRMLLQRAV
ncbi:EamA family transporter RarD [soil metagenome]